MNTAQAMEPLTLYIDNKHDYFFVENEELYEKLKNGKIRQRLYCKGLPNMDKLTPPQIKHIERSYLK